jgi:tight adherence protein C
MTSLPIPVLTAAAAVALALPLLGWAVFARPSAAAAQARRNLIRDLEPGTAAAP